MSEKGRQFCIDCLWYMYDASEQSSAVYHWQMFLHMYRKQWSDFVEGTGVLVNLLGMPIGWRSHLMHFLEILIIGLLRNAADARN